MKTRPSTVISHQFPASRIFVLLVKTFFSLLGSRLILISEEIMCALERYIVHFKLRVL